MCNIIFLQIAVNYCYGDIHHVVTGLLYCILIVKFIVDVVCLTSFLI